MMRLATPDDADLIVSIMEREEEGRVKRGQSYRATMERHKVAEYIRERGWVCIIEDEAAAFILCHLRREDDTYVIPYFLPSTMGTTLGLALIKELTQALINRDGRGDRIIGGNFDTEQAARAYQGLVEGQYELRAGHHHVQQTVRLVNDATVRILRV